jgi:hypothetical protein
MFAEAKDAQELMLDWLNRGQGLDKVLGLRRIDFNPADIDGFLVEFDKPGAVLVVPPMKSKERAEEKTETDYEGNWSRLVDIVRMTIAVERFEDLKKVVQALKRSDMVLARRPEDGFMRQSVWGFRRLKVNMVMPNGHIGELQVHLKGIFRVCVRVHELYRKAQDIAVQAKEAGRVWLTQEEASVVKQLTRFVFDQNEAAWRQYAPVQASRAVLAFMDSREYYEYGGFPVEVGVNELPVLFVGDKKVVIYDLVRFLSKATGITKEEFDLMREKGKG